MELILKTVLRGHGQGLFKPFMQIWLAWLYSVNPIPTSQGRNQPLYERQVTKFGRNRVKLSKIRILIDKNMMLSQSK